MSAAAEAAAAEAELAVQLAQSSLLTPLRSRRFDSSVRVLLLATARARSMARRWWATSPGRTGGAGGVGQGL